MRLSNVPVSPVDVLNALLPSVLPSHTALNVPVALLYASDATEVSIATVLSLLITVDVFRLSPAVKLVEPASLYPDASFGEVPCVEVFHVILFVLKFAGAAGTSSTLTVKLSLSVCAVMSGVPLAVIVTVLLPVDALL